MSFALREQGKLSWEGGKKKERREGDFPRGSQHECKQSKEGEERGRSTDEDKTHQAHVGILMYVLVNTTNGIMKARQFAHWTEAQRRIRGV
jgi:hypothetical protein